MPHQFSNETEATNLSNPQLSKVQIQKLWIRQQLAPNHIDFTEDPCNTTKFAAFAILSLQMMRMLTMKVVLEDVLRTHAMEIAMNDKDTNIMQRPTD